MFNFPNHVSSLYDPPICNFKSMAFERIKRNCKVYDLNQAVPDYLPPLKIKDTLKKFMDCDDYCFYTPDEGNYSFRNEVAKELSSLYQDISPSMIFAVAGANNAFFSLLATITSPCDEIILLSPYYFNHYMASIILNVVPRVVPLDLEKGLPIELDIIEAKINKKTKALVLVNPGNPSGKSYSQKDVDSLYELCSKYNIMLISDEVYNYFHDDYPKPASVMNVKDFEENSVSIHSYSKTFSLTGFRIGFIVASEKLLSNFLKVHDTNLICAPRISQEAVISGLKCKKWLLEKIQMMRLRKEAFVKSFNSTCDNLRLVSAGSFFVYFSYDRDISSVQFCLKMIEKENMIMLPGVYFGQEKTVRIALGKISILEVPLITEKLLKAFS